MNQYHIYEAIGRGKHSTVYKGRKKKTVEYYAIKSVEKSQKGRVLQEVRILHSLDHSNVLKFFAWYETSAHLWLVLEYCVGGDLLTLLRQDSRLPEESIHDFARDLVQALQFLHSKGVIYCDLKPSNILLDENGRLKLCDFGLARRLSEISKNSVQKLPQAKRGTPCYMAPELFEEGGVHSFASDLWALGCVIYECFAGRPPFISSSFTQLVKSILSDPVPPLKGNPSKELVDLVSLLLMKDPRKRMQWPELREHAFWRTKFKSLLLPSQPAYLTSIQLLEKKSNLGKHHHAASKESLCNVNPNLKKDSDSFGLDRSDIKKADSLTGQKAGPAFIGTAKIVPDPVRDNERQVLGGPGLSPSKESPHQANNAVNLLRLSRIVKNNLQKETEGENYRQTGLTGQLNDSDVILENNDLELDFGERIDDNDGDEILGPATSEICSKAEEHVSEPHKRSWQEDAQFASSKEKDVSAKIGIDKRSVEVGEIETSKVEGIMLIDVGATPPGVGVRRKAQHSAWNTESKNANPNPVQNGECGVISHLQVLWHPSDMAVRPIMVHRKVEKSAESMYEARMLPVESLSSLEFVKLAQEQFDIFVDKIVANVNGNTATNEKLNTLKYVESLCNNVDAANLLINGPLMTVIVKMLRTSKPPALRFQLIYVMGLLIRHATLIEDELASSGIIAVLAEGLRDKQDKVRRCSMATLGELLFYIATQNESSVRSAANDESPVKDGRSSSVWQVPNTLTSLVSSILRKGEDDATQHYALKTIENIASQRGDLAARFTNNEVIGNLCYIFKASVKQENLRVTAGSCLVRLIRHSPLNTILVLERIPIKDLVAVLMKGSSREQQVSINLLNMAMAEGSSINNINKYFMALIEERTLAPCLLNLLEQGSAILRGKAVVCAALLCKVNRRWLPLIGNAKFLSAVERLVKEKDQYIQQCVDFFVEELVALVPGVLDSISNDTQQLSSAKRTSSVSSHGRNLTKSSLSHFPVVLNLFSSSIFRYIIMSEEILSKLAGLMKKLDSASFQHQDEFQSTLLRLMEIFGQQPSFLLQFRKIFLSEILPDLAVRYRKNSDGDMRFLCVKVFFDILLVFLDELADSSSVKGPDNNQVSNLDALRCITKMHFLPLYSALIEDEDPIPVYAQKLLVMLLDIKCIMITDILQLKLISQFFEFLREDLSSINLYSVRLCLFLASAAEVETRTLSELLLVKRVSALIEFVYAKEMTDFLHPVLLLCKAFLIRCTGKNNCNESNVCDESSQCETIQDIAEFRTHAALLVDLCSSQESYIAEAAAECLFLLMGVAPRETTCIIYSSCMSSFNHALESCADSHKPVLQRWLLSVLCIACREQRLSSAGTQCSLIPAATIKDIMAAEAAVDRLKTSRSQVVVAAAQDASLELQVLSQQARILMADG